MEPGFIDLDILSNDLSLPEQTRLRALPQHGHRRRTTVLWVIEEAAGHDFQVRNLLVIRRNPVHHRHVVLWFGNQSAGHKPLAWSALHNAVDVGLDHTEIPQGEPQGNLADFLHVFPGVGFAGFHDYVAYTHL